VDMPTAAPSARTLQHPPSAVVSLVMGILGLVGLPVLGSILALVFGHTSRRQAEARPELYTDDLGRIGRILGWVGLGLVLLGLLVVVVGVLLFM
jgi:hypothetical protein